ncbi:MAG: hypothetical protein OXG41_00765 [Acidimicrobiaceae bacterium]|nr:hypothetical protein [Acidimicrobiaceae bacterium]
MSTPSRARIPVDTTEASRYEFELRSDGSVSGSLVRNGDGPLLTEAHISRMIADLSKMQDRLDIARRRTQGLLAAGVWT